MNKKQLLKGIEQIIAGLVLVQSTLDNLDVATAVEPNDTKVELDGVEAVVTSTGKFAKADLDAMSYNDLKKLAKDCDVSPKGSKDAIIERLLAIEVDVEEADVDAIVEEELEAQVEAEEATEVEEEEDLQALVEKETADMSLEEIAEILESVGKSTKGKRQSLIARLVEAVEEGLISFDDEEEEEAEEVEEEEDTTEEVEEDAEDDEEESDDEEEDEESLEDELEEIYEELSLADVKTLVKALDGKVLKKDTKETLLDKVRENDTDSIVEALQEMGIIEVEDEEEDVEEEVEADDEAEEEDEDEVGDIEEEEYFNEEVMTKERKQALAKLRKQCLADIKSGKVTMKEIEQTLADFYLPHEGYEKSLPKQEKIDMYVEAYLRLIDDEGEEQEFETPYYIDDKAVCCGHFLTDVDGSLACQVCGTEYDSEEE